MSATKANWAPHPATMQHVQIYSQSPAQGDNCDLNGNPTSKNSSTQHSKVLRPLIQRVRERERAKEMITFHLAIIFSVSVTHSKAMDMVH